MLLDESKVYGLWAYMLPLCYSDQTYKGKNVRMQVYKVVSSCFNMCVCSYLATTWNHRIHEMQAKSQRLCHVMNQQT